MITPFTLRLSKDERGFFCSLFETSGKEESVSVKPYKTAPLTPGIYWIVDRFVIVQTTDKTSKREDVFVQCPSMHVGAKWW